MSDRELQDLFEQSEDALFQRIVDRQEGALGIAERERLGGEDPPAVELARWNRALDELERRKKREEPPPAPPKRRSLRRVLLLAAIIIAALMFSATAIRAYLLNWTEQAAEKYIQLQAGESAAERVARWREAYIPEIVPEDYTISDEGDSQNFRYIEYLDSQGHRLMFFQYPEGSAVRIDVEGAATVADWLGGSARLITKGKTSIVVWDNGGCSFSIEYESDALSLDAVEEMAESLKWTE